MKLYLFFSFAYFCGSIPFGVIIGHLQGVNMQQRGSGNIGFANVRRILGWRAGLATLLGDIAKGIIPVALAQMYVGPTFAFITGLFAITGHLFPIWLKFKGGKGIATGLGVLIVLHPLVAATGTVTYLVGCRLLHNSGHSSLLGIFSVLIVGCLQSPAVSWQFVTLLVVAIFTLRKNIFGTVPNYEH